jgi:hypothetical protein
MALKTATVWLCSDHVGGPTGKKRNNGTATEELRFLCGPCRYYKQDELERSQSFSLVEADSNTSTVALLVVGGEEKGTQCRGYIWATLFLGDKNTGTRPSRLGKCRIWDSKKWSWIPRDSDPGMTALARVGSNCKRHTHPLFTKDVT